MQHYKYKSWKGHTLLAVYSFTDFQQIIGRLLDQVAGIKNGIFVFLPYIKFKREYEALSCNERRHRLAPYTAW